MILELGVRYPPHVPRHPCTIQEFESKEFDIDLITKTEAALKVVIKFNLISQENPQRISQP